MIRGNTLRENLKLFMLSHQMQLERRNNLELVRRNNLETRPTNSLECRQIQ